MSELPKRKSTRLKNFDYSSTGAYFVTICTQDRKRILSEIVRPNFTDANEMLVADSVGEVAQCDCAGGDLLANKRLAPPEREIVTQNFTGIAKGLDMAAVGEGLAPPEIQLTKTGKIAEEQLLLLETRYPNLIIEDYVIMPDHIHVIMFLHGTVGASPSPTMHDIVCTFKSLTSRMCKQQWGIEKMFQRSCAEHIIRDQKDYKTRQKYIHENPLRWYYKQTDDREG